MGSLEPCSSVLLGPRRLESFRMPRRLSRSKRLKTSCLRLKVELLRRLRRSWRLNRSVRIESRGQTQRKPSRLSRRLKGSSRRRPKRPRSNLKKSLRP
jgi:hypothetical protein